MFMAAKQTDSSKEDSLFHCGSVYHLVRISGRGSSYIFPLYDMSMRIGYASGRFFPRMTELSEYLNCHPKLLYCAADKLVASGFWKVLTAVRGKAVEYKPISHEDWVKNAYDQIQPGCTSRAELECCQKAHMPWDDEEQDQLGKDLYAVTGGVKFFPNVLKGWRRLGLDDREIVEAAKHFMELPNTAAHTRDRENLSDRLLQTKGRAFRNALGDHLRKVKSCSKM